MDAKDWEIIRALQQDGRRTTNEIADSVRLSGSAVSRRIARLEKDGIISGYTALVDPDKVGYSATVMVEITLDSQSDAAQSDFERAVAKVPSVRSCYLMSGDADYLLKVAARDLRDFEQLRRKVLSDLPHVSRMQTSFALREIVNHLEYAPESA